MASCWHRDSVSLRVLSDDVSHDPALIRFGVLCDCPINDGVENGANVVG